VDHNVLPGGGVVALTGLMNNKPTSVSPSAGGKALQSRASSMLSDVGRILVGGVTVTRR